MRFLPAASTAERAAALQLVGGAVEAEIQALGITVVVVEGASDVLSGGASPLETIARHPAVEFAELDRIVRLDFEPDDEFYLEHPDLDDGQWAIRKTRVDDAWESARGSSEITVAILDTGIDESHPDLVGAIVPGNSFLTSPDEEECVPGTTRDDNSHGTHVAGIIGATADNGEGIAGVAFGVRLMPVKVLDCTGQGHVSDVAKGIVWAVENGARIVNLSLGSMSDSRTLRDAADFAAAKDVLVVTASGNCGTTGEKCLTLNQLEYPAAYDEVLSVGATDMSDNVAFFSSRNESVDVSAPGRHIISTMPTYETFRSVNATSCNTLTYAICSGTSQAAPFVAGVAALIWSEEPGLTAEEVMERIRSTADDLGAKGRDDSFGWGRINALKAVTTGVEDFGVEFDTSTLPTAVSTGRPFIASLALTNKSSFEWKRADPGAVKVEWTWRDAGGTAVAPAGVITLPRDVAVGASITITDIVTAPETGGPHTLRFDLVRGPTAFSQRGADPAVAEIEVGTGFGVTYDPPANGKTFDAGSDTSLEVAVRNSGTLTWPSAGPNPVRLSYHWVQNGAVVEWEGLRAPLPADLPPGARVTLSLPVAPPDRAGTYTLRLDMVQEGIAWYSSLGAAPLDIEARVVSAYVATYQVGTPPIVLPGGRAAIPVTATNTGTATWTAGGPTPVRLASHLLDSAGAVITWDGLRTVLPADVAPGGTVETTVIVDAPTAPGSYLVRVDAVREGVAWLSGLGVAAGQVDLLVAADYRAELPTGPLAVSAADPSVEVTIKNLGVATWTIATTSPIAVSAHWYDAAGNVLVWDGPRTPLTAAVPAGGEVKLRVALGTPPTGAASVTIDLVSEGLRWFGAGLPRPVTLGP